MNRVLIRDFSCVKAWKPLLEVNAPYRQEEEVVLPTLDNFSKTSYHMRR